MRKTISNVDYANWEGEEFCNLFRVTIKMDDGTVIFRDYETPHEARMWANNISNKNAEKLNNIIIVPDDETMILKINTDKMVYIRVDDVEVLCYVITTETQEGEKKIYKRIFKAPASVGHWTVMDNAVEYFGRWEDGGRVFQY